MKLFPFLAAAAIVMYAADTPAVFELHNVTVRQSEDGAVAGTGWHFQPGDKVWFSAQVAGYEKSDEGAIKLSYNIEARDPADLLIAPPATGTISTTLSSEDKKWMPKIRANFEVPQYALAGTYHVIIHVHDDLGKRDTQSGASFTVDAPAIPPAGSIMIRNVRFSRSESGTPLQIAAYSPGDTIWVKFDIAGYKLAPGYSFDVSYGFKILRADGQMAFEQPQAARQQKSSLYPQRYTPAVFSITTPPNMQRGSYTLLVEARDNIGEQSTEAQSKFDIE